jgi:hypothetical protein
VAGGGVVWLLRSDGECVQEVHITHYHEVVPLDTLVDYANNVDFPSWSTILWFSMAA